MSVGKLCECTHITFCLRCRIIDEPVAHDNLLLQSLNRDMKEYSSAHEQATIWQTQN
jgi:hypothetical protein